MTNFTAANIVLAIGGLNGFVSTEVQNSTPVLRIKFSAKNPAHRQYVNRWLQARNLSIDGDFINSENEILDFLSWIRYFS
mgnify:CR=1 FL=1